jgi:cytochrome oxidase assembly protein ShyY1
MSDFSDLASADPLKRDLPYLSEHVCHADDALKPVAAAPLSSSNRHTVYLSIWYTIVFVGRWR